MDNQSENNPYFGFFQDRNDEYFHIRANKEGLIYLANQLLDKAEKLDDQSLKNWQNRTLLHLNDEFIDINSDLVFVSIEKARTSIELSDSSFRFLNIFKAESFLFILIAFVVLCLIVGFFTIFIWLIQFFF